MKQCSKCEVLKDESEFHRNSLSPDGVHTSCKVCRNASTRAAYHEQGDLVKHRARIAKWRSNNLDRVRELNRKSHNKNKEKRNADSSKYRAENREKTRALCRQWAKDNADKMRITNADRRAKKKNAIPLWAGDELDRLIVSEAYDLAKRRTDVMGIQWHVDHVVPLRNKRVCGLHCAANLQVITAVANHVKGNRVWPDM